MDSELVGFLAATVSGSLLASAFLKAAQPEPFRLFLHSIFWKPSATRFLVVLIPAVELGLGVALLTRWAAIAAVGAAGLSLGFLAAAARAISSPHTPGCGCFGALDESTPHWVTLARAMMIAAASVICVLATRAGGNGSAPLFVGAVGVLAGASVAVSMTLLGRVVQFRATLRRLLLAEVGSR